MPLSENAPSGVLRSRLRAVRRAEEAEYKKTRSLRIAWEEHRLRRMERERIKAEQKALEEAIAAEKRFNKRRREQQARRRAAIDARRNVIDEYVQRRPPPRVEIDLTSDSEISSCDEDIPYPDLPAPPTDIDSSSDSEFFDAEEPPTICASSTECTCQCDRHRPHIQVLREYRDFTTPCDKLHVHVGRTPVPKTSFVGQIISAVFRFIY